ncbi:MAG: phage antirepressor protein, partial [Candidatus Nanoarchaeia archaeon]
RGLEEEKDFAILTNEITKATFGKNVQEYKEYKNVPKKNQNLRDHMTDWELIFTMLGEKATTDITQTRDDHTFDECKASAQRGGKIASHARKELEQEIGKTIVSNHNFLGLTTTKKKLTQK